MQKKVLFLIFTVLLGGVSILLFFLVNSSNIKNISFYQKSKTVKDKNSSYTFKKNSWTKKLSAYKKDDYLFPVTELFLTMKFAKHKKRVIVQKKERYYTLIIPDLNNYSLFCILQIFNKKNVPYVIENDYENSKIFVQLDKKSRLEMLSNELKKYDIFPKIQNR